MALHALIHFFAVADDLAYFASIQLRLLRCYAAVLRGTARASLHMFLQSRLLSTILQLPVRHPATAPY